jgi:hypothetical protein
MLRHVEVDYSVYHSNSAANNFLQVSINEIAGIDES